MCGRYYIDEDNIKMQKIINKAEKIIDTKINTGEIFPSSCVPIIIQDKENNKLKSIIAKWGLPKWKGKGIIINSRIETVNEKPIFKNLAFKNRCIIPASAFFEWKNSNSKNSKEKYSFQKSDSIIYFAGLYKEFHPEENSQLSLFDTKDYKDIRFTILTREANDYVSSIHDRMPVILNNNDINFFLNYEKNITYLGEINAEPLIVKKI